MVAKYLYAILHYITIDFNDPINFLAAIAGPKDLAGFNPAPVVGTQII